MDYSIDLSDDQSYIQLTITGELNRKKAVNINLKAHALGKKHNIDRYLVDVRNARNTDSIMQSYEFAYSDMQNTDGIDKSATVAAIVDPDDHSHDFLETVAKNAGIDINLFTDERKAIEHLVSQKTSQVAD